MKLIVFHVLTIFSERKKDSRNNFIIRSIALIFNYSQYDELKIWFRHFVIVLCFATENEEFRIAHDFFTNLESSIPQEYKQEDIDRVKEMSKDDDANTVYLEQKKSTMYAEFSHFASNVRASLETIDNDNVPN